MTLSSQPIGCRGYRETTRAPITALPRAARLTSGQPCTAMVASDSSGWKAETTTVSATATHSADARQQPGEPGAHSAHQRGGHPGNGHPTPDPGAA